MKKKRFKELMFKHHERQDRSCRKLFKQLSLGKSNHAAVEYMQRHVERQSLLSHDSVPFFSGGGIEQQHSDAAKKTAKFVQSPYGTLGYSRGDKLTRSERKKVIVRTAHYAQVLGIKVTLGEIGNIVNRYCPYKPVRGIPTTSFMVFLRSETNHPNWVNDLSQLCLRYVQLGADFPMWVVFQFGAAFTYKGLPHLQLVIRNQKADVQYAEPHQGGVFTSGLPFGHMLLNPRLHGSSQIKSAMFTHALLHKVYDIIDKTNAATQDAFVDAAKTDFPKIVIHGSLDCLAHEEEVQPLTRLEQIQMNSLKHLEPRAKK